MCKFKDTNLGIKKLDFNVKRGAAASFAASQDRCLHKILQQEFPPAALRPAGPCQDQRYEPLGLRKRS